MDIQEIINNVYEIPSNSLNSLMEKMQLVILPKGNKPIKAYKRIDDIFFVRKGIARAFYPIDGKEITFWLGAEGSTLFSSNSIVEDKPGYETIELLEDSELYHIRHHDLQLLFEDDIHLANWGMKLFEKQMLMTEKRLISLSFKTAVQRYVELLKYQADLIKRVPVNQLATYIGIT